MSDKLREIKLLVEGYSYCISEKAKENQIEAIMHCVNTRHEPKHETVDQWISVGDRLPEDEKSVLVIDVYKGYESIGILKRDADGNIEPLPWRTMHDGIFHNYIVTHWQSLPEPPNSIGEKL